MNFLKLDLQLFASKKGVGSTKNGRDSIGRRLGSKLSDGQMLKLVLLSIVKEELRFIQELTVEWVKIIHYLHLQMEQLNMKEKEKIKNK